MDVAPEGVAGKGDLDAGFLYHLRGQLKKGWTGDSTQTHWLVFQNCWIGFRALDWVGPLNWPLCKPYLPRPARVPNAIASCSVNTWC